MNVTGVDGPTNIAEINQPSSWVTTDFLRSIGYQFNLVLGLLVCMGCKKGWVPTSVLGHSHAKHGVAKATQESETSLDALVAEYNIVPKPKLHPAPSKVPIRGLYIHKGGYSCRVPNCSYACQQLSAIQTHFTRTHTRLTQTVPTSERWNFPVFIQSYYSNLFNSYWEVDPQLADDASGDLYRSFVTDYLPMLNAERPMPPPVTSRDIPPWLRMSGFFTYMGDYATDTDKRTELVELMSRPRSKDAFYGKLHLWVFEYMSGIRADSSDVQYTFLRRILHGAGE
jgi:hypothetical protein